MSVLNILQNEICITVPFDNFNDIIINNETLKLIDEIFNENYSENEYIKENNNDIEYHVYYEIIENNTDDDNTDDDNEEFDYFINCKEIDKILCKSEKIKKDDILINNNEHCNICYDNYSIGQFKRVLPECKHCFHKKCVDKWLKSKSNCPICRCNLLKKNKK
jgi:hypothetical protein